MRFCTSEEGERGRWRKEAKGRIYRAGPDPKTESSKSERIFLHGRTVREGEKELRREGKREREGERERES